MSPPESVQFSDATDGLDAFASEPGRSSSRIANLADDMKAGSPVEDAPPELVWLVDAGHGLDEFAPLPDQLPLRIERDASPLMDVQIPPPTVVADWTGTDVFSNQPSRLDWIKRASRAALVCSVLAAAADGLLRLQPPATPASAVEAPEPAIDDPQNSAALPSIGVDLPPARELVAWTAPSRSPRVERRVDVRGARSAGAQDVSVRSVSNVAAPSRPRAGSPPTPAPAPPGLVVTDPRVDAPDTRVENTAAAAGSRSPSTISMAAILAPDTATSAGAAPTSVSPSSVVAGPSAPAPSPAATVRSASAGVSVDAAAVPTGRELEARAIEHVLGRYRNAFNRLDSGAAVAVWPSVNEKTLARAFERLEDQNVSFDRCQIEIVAVLAEAACSGSARYVPKVGSRTPKAEARQWRFSLRKATDGWLIDRVDAR